MQQCVRKQIYVVSVSKVLVKCCLRLFNSCCCSLSRVGLMKLEGLLKIFTHMFEKAGLIKKASCKQGFVAAFSSLPEILNAIELHVRIQCMCMRACVCV